MVLTQLTKEQAKVELKKLVAQFKENYSQYKKIHIMKPKLGKNMLIDF